jgi:hypothetical protein
MEELKMAGRPRKTTTTSKTTEAKVEKPVDDLKEKLDEIEIESTIEQKVKEVKTAKKEAKQFDDEDMVLVASIKSGRTYLRNNEKPYDEYIFEKFGDVQEVRYGRLDTLRRKLGEDPFKTMLYVLDEDVVKQLRLGKIYENIGKLADLEKAFYLKADEFIRFVDNCPEQTREILREILSDKLERKEDINVFNLQIWAEKLKMDFDIKDLKR